MSEPSFYDRMASLVCSHGGIRMVYPSDALKLASEADRRLNYLAQMIGTEIRAITGDTYADTPAEPGDAMGELREKVKGLQAKYIAAEQSATVALQAQTIIGLQAKLAESQREAESMENQLDRLEEAATAITPYPDGYRPTAWEAVFELPEELGKARERATLVPQLVAALKSARGFIASTSHSVTGIERQIDAAIAAGEGR